MKKSLPIVAVIAITLVACDVIESLAEKPPETLDEYAQQIAKEADNVER